MPNKFNAKCRHHIPKMKYTVRNWAEYDAALRARGSLTLWVTPEALNHWAALPRSTPGGQCFYSDLAIETSLMLRLVFRQPLRQTEGLMASIFELLAVDLKAPDHSTVSRRAMSLKSISTMADIRHSCYLIHQQMSTRHWMPCIQACAPTRWH